MIRKNRQLVVSSVSGDCFRACLTSILCIPNDPALPLGNDPDWFHRWTAFLDQFGLELHCRSNGYWQQGYWIASVPSKNFPRTTHAIVMHGQEVEWDPTTSDNPYPTGLNLLGHRTGASCAGGTVLAGYMITLTDASKIGVLAELQRESSPDWLRAALDARQGELFTTHADPGQQLPPVSIEAVLAAREEIGLPDHPEACSDCSALFGEGKAAVYHSLGRCTTCAQLQEQDPIRAAQMAGVRAMTEALDREVLGTQDRIEHGSTNPGQPGQQETTCAPREHQWASFVTGAGLVEACGGCGLLRSKGAEFPTCYGTRGRYSRAGQPSNWCRACQGRKTIKRDAQVEGGWASTIYDVPCPDCSGTGIERGSKP